MIDWAPQAEPDPPGSPLPGLKGAVTFFYYEDLASAAAFYERVLALPRVMFTEWCALFEIRPGVMLGLVDAVAGSQRPLPGRSKGAIISLETEAVEACLARMKQLGVAAPDLQLERGCAGRTWEFKIWDPGGYCVEFFQWIEPPW